MEIILVQPRGFCAGVVRAIDIVERALDIYNPPIYVLHEIVHNRYVVDSLKARGAIFVETPEEIPTGAVCIFSAHGVATAVVAGAEQRQLHTIDATCPLVKKVHAQAQCYVQQGLELIIVGHRGHPEVEGTRGRATGTVHIVSTVAEANALTVKDPQRVAYVTQTTLSTDDTRDVISALTERFPTIQGPDINDICYATQNRQNAVRKLADQIDVLLVVGAQNSSNSNRLKEVGTRTGIQSYLIQDAHDLQATWFTNKPTVGITAGASAPEVLVESVLTQLRTWGVSEIKEMDGEKETTTFKIPTELLRPTELT